MTVLETFHIPPPAGGAAELTVSLSYFDMLWLHFHPIRRLLFYQHPCSNPEFFDTILPQLKQSLSLTLKHYLPVAGNILYPSDTDNKPVLRYVAGDSVQLTVAESSLDFDELVGNHARDADQFYDFVPQMPHVRDEHEHKIVPLFALQVTLFPGRGFCIGFANHHSLGDASSIVGFMLAWAWISKHGGDEEFLAEKSESLPVFDRSLLNDHLGLDEIFWKTLSQMPLKESSFPLPTNRVRASYVLQPADIKKLKDMVLAKNPGLVQVSSFVVTTSYIWSCLIKSGDAVGEQVEDNVEELFGFPVDARGRMDPPLPANYFGNCLGSGIVSVEHKKLTGDEGFVIAAETVAEEIKNRVSKKGELLKGVENWINWMKDSSKFIGTRVLGISGSPKFDLTSADFGWGKARKLEVASIDGEKYSMSLGKSTQFQGGLEAGLSLPRDRMDAFASLFANGLTS